MGTVKKGTSITDRQAERIKAQIASGHYNNDSEIIRAALIEGERSGASGRTPEEIFASAKERLRADSSTGFPPARE